MKIDIKLTIYWGLLYRIRSFPCEMLIFYCERGGALLNMLLLLFSLLGLCLVRYSWGFLKKSRDFISICMCPHPNSSLRPPPGPTVAAAWPIAVRVAPPFPGEGGARTALGHRRRRCCGAGGEDKLGKGHTQRLDKAPTY